MDIRLRYRGSILGPFWLTLSTGIMVGALGFVYSKLFHLDMQTYLPFLSLSLVLWNFLSTTTAEGCLCFTQSETMIRSAAMPFTMYAARVVVRNFLTFAHNIVVIVVVFAILHRAPGSQSLLVVPALAIWVIDAFAITVLLGVVCARFRDVPPIVASLLQIAFFVTPIMWNPSIFGHASFKPIFVQWNPFYVMVEIVRGPLLGSTLFLNNWLVALLYSAAILVVATLIFALARPRIAYWI